MKALMKGLVAGLVLTGAVSIAAGYSNPIEGGSSETVTNNWDAGFQLTVGESTANNTLSITNEGSVFDGVGIIGELTGSDGNSVVVSGSGTTWTNVSDLAVGNGGSFNALTIEDGGVVYNANGVIGVEEYSVNNSVVATGTNSVWENSDTLMVGRKGDANTLQILDGATVSSSFGAIGFENPATDNSVLVSGAGSTWNNSGDLLIGSVLNSGNHLTITNGGKVVVGGQLSIYNDLYLNEGGWLKIAGHSDLESGSDFHYNAGSTLEVTGSVWFDGHVRDRNTLIFQGENATWLGSSISTLNVGETGDDSTVVISNKANITTDTTYIGKEVSSSGNKVLVTGADSTFTVLTNFYAGYNGSDNELRVMDGAAVSATTGYVGHASSANNNQIVIEGEGSSFENTDATFLGFGGGESNRIEVLDGGNADFGSIYVGYTNALHSSVLVDGSNSTFSANEIHIGEASQFNAFVVTNGAQVSSGTSTIGTGANGDNNSAIVSGAGSFWEAGGLSIGDDEATNINNSLTIENGGKVVASELVIATNGTDNVLNLNEGGWLTVASDMNAGQDGFNWAAWSTLEVQGILTNMNEVHDGIKTLILSNGGIWSNDINVTIGDVNSSNQLKLVNGGIIKSSEGVIGFGASSDFNTVEISGSGSEWENYSDFIVGEYGSDNLLTITDNGRLDAWSDSVIGYEVGADRNAVVVHGSGSHMFNGFGTIFVGLSGSSNTLSALDGGQISSGAGVVGLASDHNQVLLDGSGSQWSMSSSLRVGILGSSNEFTVSNGGIASVAGSTYIGDLAGADNRLVVDGINSRLYNTLNIHVGHMGSGNELVILDGAKVYDDIGLLGTDNGADHNSALIDGAYSVWYNEHTFFAGNSGSSNTVTVQNGATLADTTGYIGYHTNAIGNRVVVDNADWVNRDNLFVGFNGSGNSLVITNGAEVFSGESRIGTEGFANDNQVLVTGEGSVWNITKSLLVGNSANSNNTLVVEDGGKVVVDENISVGFGSWLNVNTGGTMTVYGNTIFTDGFNIASGGTFETFGGISGLGGVVESGQTIRLSGSNATWNPDESILLESGAMLDIGAGATVSTPSNYTQQANATLRFGMATNNVGAPLSGSLQVGQVADFADGANFIYNSDIGALSFDKTYTNTLVQSDILVVGGQTNATTQDLAQYLNSAGTLVGITFVAETNKILAIVNRISFSDGLDLSDDVLSVMDEVNDRAAAGDPLANKQLGIIDGLSSAQASAELMQFYARGIPTYQHMGGVLQGLKQIDKRTTELLMETGYYVKPIGAYGPAADSEWRGWMSAYGSQGDRDASSGLSGYDASTYGTVLGIDKAFNNMIVGLAGGTAGSTIDQDDGDTSDATTIYGALYASTRLKNIDWDLIGSYGSSSIESESGTVFGSKAEMDASTMAFYIGASEETISGPMTFTPIAAFQIANYSQDGYDEVSGNAIGRSVDDYDRWSYQSIVGGTVGAVKMLENFDLITRVRASWQHEFNTDTDTLDYTLIGGTSPHYFTIQAPISDSFDLGASLSALFGNNLEVSLGLDGRYSKEFMAISYNGKIQYSF